MSINSLDLEASRDFDSSAGDKISIYHDAPCNVSDGQKISSYNDAPGSSERSMDNDALASHVDEISKLKKSLLKHMRDFPGRDDNNKSYENIISHPIWTKLDKPDSAFVQDVLVHACSKFPGISLKDRLDFISWLIEKKGARVNEAGHDNCCLYNHKLLPLERAVRLMESQVDVVKFLISKGAIVPATIFSSVNDEIGERGFAYLLKRGVSPASEFGRTTVAHHAVKRGWVSVLKISLLTVNPNLRDARNKTLLEVACDFHNHDIISLLIESGADRYTHIPPDPFVDPKTGCSVGNLYSMEHRYTGSWPRPPCCICEGIIDPFIERKSSDIHLIVCRDCAHNVKRKLTSKIAEAFANVN